MNLIWVTRGRTWGFRFLLDGGARDPLLAYDEVFSGLEGEPLICRRVADKLALRFPDPEGRRDAAGRVIPHEFVVSGPRAQAIDSVEDGLRQVWPLVADRFAQIWDLPTPPTTLGTLDKS